MKIGSLCSGYGGLELGVQAVYGGTTAWVSDIDKGACKILAHRFPEVPNIGDMTTVDWAEIEPVDLISGGTPCQDLSHAGKRAGMTEGTRSNLWVAMREAIATIRPRYVVWENVRGAYSAAADSAVVLGGRLLGPTGGGPALRALGRVLGDLSDLGYDASWHGLRAADSGAPHGRFRVFVVAADANNPGRGERRGTLAVRAEQSSVERAGQDALTLLPTPNPFHAGNTEQPDDWRRRRADVFARTGTRHGPALSVVALSILEGHPLVPDNYMPDEEEEAPCSTDDDTAARRNSAPTSAASSRTTSSKPTKRPASASTTGSPPASSSKPSTDLSRRTEPEEWGDYAAAIARWEHILGRPAPEPTMTSSKGNPQLSPAFVEWMMGLPAGWVTDVPGITRNEALKALGNGVVPQQAAEALRIMAAWQVAA